MAIFNPLNWSLTNNATVITADDEAALENVLNTFTLPSQFAYRIVGKGGKYTLVAVEGQFTSPEAQDALDKFTGLTQTEIDAIRTFVDAEVANGNWGTQANSYTDSLYDAFWCFGLVTEANALINMHPVNTITATNNGATKVSDGFSFDGVNDFIDSNYTPSVDGVNMSVNDALMGVFNKSFTNDTVLASLGGTLDTENMSFQNQSATQVRIRMFSNSVVNKLTRFGTDALNVFARTSSPLTTWFKDGVSVETDITASGTFPTNSIYMGARNSGAGADQFSNSVLSTFITGGAIGFDQSGHNTNIVNLLTSLGVLP